MSHVVVQVGSAPIDANSGLLELSGETECGAELLFIGVVRKRNLGKEVVAVAYDAFEPLAEKVLSQICEEARAQWGEALKIRVIHRTGKLSVGEASVLIGVSSPHRDAAYQASRYVIEELKVRAPIWKKEYYSDGETEWLKGHALCSHGAGRSGGGHVHPHGHG